MRKVKICFCGVCGSLFVKSIIRRAAPLLSEAAAIL